MAPQPRLIVTLDAKRRIALVARALDLPVATLGWGYWELLEHVWERKEPSVTALLLAACFGADSRIPAALVEFGFLVVKGTAWELCAEEADRLLRTHRQRVAAGKARTASGKRSAGGRLQRATSEPPANHQRPASGPPAADLLLQPAAKKGLAGSAGADPRGHNFDGDATYKTLVNDLFIAFEAERGVKYDPAGKDWRALEGLRKKHAPEEILRRWKIGLQARYAARCSTFWDLGQRWNACAAPEASQGPSRGNSGADPNRGIMTRAPASDLEREEQEEVRRRLEALNG